MRIVLPLALVVCCLSAAVTADMSTATGRGTVVAASGDDDIQYRVLQRQADLALDALRQSRERRLAATQVAAN